MSFTPDEKRILFEGLAEVRGDIKQILKSGCPTGAAAHYRLDDHEYWKRKGIIGAIVSMFSALASVAAAIWAAVKVGGANVRF